MKRVSSALLVFLPTFFGLLGILWFFDDHRPSKFGPAYDQNQMHQIITGIVIGAGTLWLWLNTFFKLAKISVLDGLCAIMVPVCVLLQLVFITQVRYFKYSGDDGWLVEPMIMGSYVVFALFALGFQIILSQRYGRRRRRAAKKGLGRSAESSVSSDQ